MNSVRIQSEILSEKSMIREFISFRSANASLDGSLNLFSFSTQKFLLLNYV